MRDYSATKDNPTTISCHKMNHQAGVQVRNDTLGDDLKAIANPANPDVMEFEAYSLSRTDTHVRIAVDSRIVTEIPWLWVPTIINDLTD